MTKCERYGGEYYKVIDLEQSIKDRNCFDILGDITLIPFYLTSGSTYEIYDYELNIRIVKQSERNKYFLAKTGKTSLETIDQETLKKLELCYVEITREKRTEATAQIKKYIEYLLNSPKVRKRIPEKLGEFCKENLYFEAYFY